MKLKKFAVWELCEMKSKFPWKAKGVFIDSTHLSTSLDHRIRPFNKLVKMWSLYCSASNLYGLCSVSLSSLLMIASDAKRTGASSQESFFPLSYGTSNQSNVSETILFFDIVYRTKNISVWSYNRFSWWAGSPRPGRKSLWRVISQSVQKRHYCNFNKMWLPV